MRSYVIVCFLILCTCVKAQVFSPGTSLERVQSELGIAESRLEQGSKEILIYADGTRLEFIDGKLVAPSRLFQSPQQGVRPSKADADDPLVNAQSIVEQRQQQTISASTNRAEIDYSQLAENYGDRKTLEAELRAEEASSPSAGKVLSKNTLRVIVITGGIEFFVTFLLLALALQICGFSSALWPALLLGLAVAIVGALLDTLIQVGPFHPLRFAAGFAILLFGIAGLVQPRRWGAAITIAALARLAFILFAWLGLYGLGELLNI